MAEWVGVADLEAVLLLLLEDEGLKDGVQLQVEDTLGLDECVPLRLEDSELLGVQLLLMEGVQEGLQVGVPEGEWETLEVVEGEGEWLIWEEKVGESVVLSDGEPLALWDQVPLPLQEGVQLSDSVLVMAQVPDGEKVDEGEAVPLTDLLSDCDQVEAVGDSEGLAP